MQMSISTASVVQDTAVELPVEVVTAFSRRGAGVVEFPSDVESVLEEAIGTGKKRGLRRQCINLQQELRVRSRSTSRGGVNVLQSLDVSDAGSEAGRPNRKAGRRERNHWQDRVDRLLNTTYALGRDEAMQTARPCGSESDEDSPSSMLPLSKNAAREALRKPVQYHDQAIAYGASRMPGCYAAVHSVMEELRMRLPAFLPSSMLDFGSGPGTAIWAAQQVWDGRPNDVLAVEPSSAMSALGVQIQAGIHQNSPSFAEASQRGSIRWVHHLPGTQAAKGSPKGVSGRKRWPTARQYDMVTCAYVLGELKSDNERKQAVDALWASTGDLLVLVEPGTPTGSAYILEARRQVLEGSMGQEGIGEVHVVAPCPHEGACPMEGTGSWCHFVQRFRRSNMQRIAKIRPDGGLARDYQDERYSFVVLRKGPRPQAHAAVSIARHARHADQLNDTSKYTPLPRAWRKSESRMRQAKALQQLIDEMEVVEEPAESSGSIEERTEWLVRQSLCTGDDEDSEDLVEELSLLQDTTPFGSSDAAESSAGLGKAAGNAWSSDAEEMTTEVVDESSNGAEPSMTDPQGNHAESVDDGEDGSDEDEEVVQVADEQVSEVAAMESHHWGRIIRQPRKRNKHIILDVCAATASLPQHQKEQLSLRHAPKSFLQHQGRSAPPQHEAGQLGQEGVLVQQVIAAADKKAWLGPGGYRLARKARWGDLWPTYYANRAITPRVRHSKIADE